MAWFSGRVNLGNLSDLAGAVKNISDSVSEGVKNIEKNFDSALGLEEKNAAASSSNEASGLWSNPVMSFMGQKDGDGADEPQLRVEESKASSSGEEEAIEQEGSDVEAAEKITHLEEVTEKTSDSIVPPVVAEEEKASSEEKNDHPLAASSEISNDVSPIPTEQSETNTELIEEKDSLHIQEESLNKSLEEHPKDLSAEELPKDFSVEPSELGLEQPESTYSEVQISAAAPVLQGLDITSGSLESNEDQKTLDREVSEEVLPIQDQDSSTDSFTEREEPSVSGSIKSEETEKTEESSQINLPVTHQSEESAEIVSEPDSVENDARSKTLEMTGPAEDEINVKPESSNPVSSSLTTADPVAKLEKMTKEMKIMENALQGAARQAQAKADEIARMMNENEQLKAVIDDLRRKSNDAEIESIREEYHQRVSVLERKVYALTRERDTLRRESNKKSDAAALLKEKDEIITQVMAEGEQLSKKQATQESTIRKLRAQIRELEEEKKGLATKLEVEESKVESIKKDKAATEKLLQETIERHQTELTTQKDYYTSALNAAKEAESLAEARANSEARTELESRIREAEEREAMLVQALEELRQTLTRKEQQAVSREDMLQREIEDLQKRYQASERRCEELITQVPESTRPLLRQIEAIQDTTARKAEAWAAVERSLTLRLQEAEGKAAGAEERERSINERLSQTLSRINVLEAQISCLRAEQTQLTRSLEKERQRAAENRQEYLALKEEADTNEGRAKQLEEEIKDMRKRHKQEIQEAITKQELLHQELEKEKAARLDQEKAARPHVSTVSDQSPFKRKNLALDDGILSRKPSSASSLSSMEESYFLQASLDSSDDFLDRRNAGEGAVSPYMKSTALRQKEGEIASYMSRLASLESIRDSLAEELVKLTAQCEKLKAESALLPGVRAELDALRRRHSAALELMGERDEELEELRNDIVDLKEMYREQVNLLVNKIQTLNSTG